MKKKKENQWNFTALLIYAIILLVIKKYVTYYWIIESKYIIDVELIIYKF